MAPGSPKTIGPHKNSSHFCVPFPRNKCKRIRFRLWSTGRLKIPPNASSLNRPMPRENFFPTFQSDRTRDELFDFGNFDRAVFFERALSGQSDRHRRAAIEAGDRWFRSPVDAIDEFLDLGQVGIDVAVHEEVQR